MTTPTRRSTKSPALVLGAMNFGTRTDEAESRRIVRRALERGIRAFDTANSYNGGESERILGRALGRDREGVSLTTKGGLGLIPGKPEGLSPEVLHRAFSSSLERLGTDYVDHYYLHVPDRKTPIDKTLIAMKELLSSGRVRSWGTSNYASWEVLEMITIADAQGFARPVVTQALYNVLHRQIEVEFLSFARRFELQAIAYNALAGGLLARPSRWGEPPPKGTRFDGNRMYQRRYWTETMFQRRSQVEAVAEADGCSLVELSYAWLASRNGVDAILVGAATVEQLDAAMNAIARPLSDASLARLDALWLEWLGTDTNYVR